MPQALAAQAALDLEVFRETSDHLFILAGKLPEDAVHALANEVVKRLSENFRNLERIAPTVAPELIEELCDALVSSDPDAGALMVAGLQFDGTSVADIYLVYLSAAARRLGEKWVSDDLTFVEVTLGTSRILAIMRSMRDAFKAKQFRFQRVAVFASVPGELHTIGVTMATDLFRRAGWDIELLVGRTHDEILDWMARSVAPVIGLTAHGEQSLPALVRLIAGLRIVCPAVHILISGHIVDEAEDVIALTGADGIARNISDALKEVERLHDTIRG